MYGVDTCECLIIYIPIKIVQYLVLHETVNSTGSIMVGLSVSFDAQILVSNL